MSDTVQLAVLIGSISTKVDGSVKLVLETRELNSDHAAKLFSLRGREAWAVLATSEIAESEIPKEAPNTEMTQKTPSARFRSRMFVYFTKALNGNPLDFDDWYKKELDRLGSKYLEKVTEDV